MDESGDYSRLIAPFIAPKSPRRLWQTFDHVLQDRTGCAPEYLEQISIIDRYLECLYIYIYIVLAIYLSTTSKVCHLELQKSFGQSLQPDSVGCRREMHCYQRLPRKRDEKGMWVVNLPLSTGIHIYIYTSRIDVYIQIDIFDIQSNIDILSRQNIYLF